jgi:external thioesterase TEII
MIKHTSQVNRPQLFLVHFAGGSCFSYDFLKPFLGKFEVISLELPGRGRRINEALLKDFDLAALDLYNQILPKLKTSVFFLFGHSMGASLVLRLSKLLENSNVFPSCLFISGNSGPDGAKKKKYLLDDKEFIAEVKKLGGIPNEILEDEPSLNFYLPILKADMEISENNNLALDKPVNSSIFAIMGNMEEDVDSITNLKKHTHSEFDYKIFNGGHFFIYHEPWKISTIITGTYDRLSVL